MQLLQFLFLGLVQGITEFLPVSSSGHLNLVQQLFNLTPSLTLNIFFHSATFLSVLFFFRKKVKFFFSYLPQIFIASIPAALVGVFFNDKIEEVTANPALLPFLFLITSAFVFSTKFIKVRDNKINYLNAFIIGCFQALAILPAVSRSGSTIFSALLLGLSPVNAFNFSFSLFIPVSVGAIALELKDMASANLFTVQNLFVFIFTFLVGVVALTFLEKVLSGRKFWVFGVYTFILSIILFLI